MEKKKRQQVFRDPLYGYIHIEYDLITHLIDTSVFQRLRRIRQLSGVHMVFHAAEHSRFSHSLGVYELAYRFSMIPEIKEALTEREELLFLASALLHDIGHGAYSHAFEYVFKVNHEKIGANMIKNHPELRQVLNEVDDTFADDVASIILKEKKYPLIEQVISSQLDIDRLDYLERDAYFTGAAYGHIDLDRLMRVVIVKDKKLVFKASGIHAIENYLVARYHMYWQVYYHPKARAYEVILEKIYLRVKDLLEQGFDFKQDVTALKAILKNPEDMYAYLEVDDFYMNGLIAYFLKSEDKILNELAHDFLNRKIWDYIDDTEENQAQINAILSSMTEEEKHYYTLKTSVTQGAYNATEYNLGDQIYILNEKDKVVPLSKHSSIVHSLITSSMKIDPKFFYKKI
ncbi:HD domain-containing protein [Acholeplasma equirhinis]|uniref:HD domain-containing protein n=1 Tax=Acholeplasma equirhinis TaxID=555393 RepID=UPI00197AC345|nr:HD domain-containing protein [Acholeplasma equirhinis]MBN3491063.1 HD domain-containing protein [Acholeplasma equirhinis]